jgi:hypothetical protein
MVMRWLAPAVLAAATIACGQPGRDMHRAFNSRDVGSWISLGRATGEDGSLTVHVGAAKPENAEEIAYHIVRQNFGTSALPIRVIVDPMVGRGDRRVYRWDGRTLAADTSTADLPPRASRPDADGAEAAPH